MSQEQKVILCGETLARGNIGLVLLLLGNYDAARPAFTQALRLAREVGNRWGETLMLLNLGQVRRQVSDLLF